MKRLIPFVFILLAGCGNSRTLPSYEELLNYPLSCNKKFEQFSELKNIQRIKNFSADLDSLSFDDRKYNALLKDHLWWFVYNCEQ